MVVLVATLVLATAGCTLSSAGQSPPSTIAPGSPWSGAFVVAVPPAPVNGLTAVDCPTATKCWATGSTVGGGDVPNGAAVIASTNGGATWSPQVIPPVAAYLSGVSCSDQRTCVAVGQATQSASGQGVIIATTDGGRSWQPRPVPPGTSDVTAVTCRTDRHCVAIADVGAGASTLWSASAGTAWVQRGPLPAGESGATSVSCADDTHCWVTAHRSPDPDHVAGTVSLTSDAGSTWTPLATPAGIGYLNGISCPSPGTALPYSGSTTPSSGAPAPAGATTTPNVAQSPAVPATAPNTTAPAGVPGADCTAVGSTSNTLGSLRSGHGVVITTGNGGGSWSNQPVPATAASLLGVSCTASTSCVVAGTSVSSSPTAGALILTGPPSHPWTRSSVLAAPQALSAVSCVSESSCVVVGEAISEHLAGR